MKKVFQSRLLKRVITAIAFLCTTAFLCVAQTGEGPSLTFSGGAGSIPEFELAAEGAAAGGASPGNDAGIIEQGSLEAESGAMPGGNPSVFTQNAFQPVSADPGSRSPSPAVSSGNYTYPGGSSMPSVQEIVYLDEDELGPVLASIAAENPAGVADANVDGQQNETETVNEMTPDELEQRQLSGLDARMLKPISVDFRETPVEDVLRIIAEQAGVDIIKSPNVQGTVTAKLTDVPLEEALNNILIIHGFSFTASKNMIRVGTAAEINTVAERLVNRVYRIIYADIEEVEKAITKFISSRGSISASPSTSNLIVTDIESRIKAIDEFIEEIDRQTPQVLVEVRIYDVTTTDNYDMGISWNIGRNNTDEPGVTDIDHVGEDYGLSDTADKTRSNTPFMAGSFDRDNGGAIRIGLLDNTIDIDILFQMLHKDIGAKLLANPRIMVLDNGTAKFKIVREIPYTEQTDTSAGGSFTSTKFKEVGVELLVTPHITRDDMLRLHILPKFGVVVGNLTQGQPPTVDTREINTVALVEDQQTVVLGGLRKRETSQTIHKAPVLGDLPLLGGLFRDTTEEVVTNELMIFITPRVIIEPKLMPHEQRVYDSSHLPPAGDPDFSKFESDYDKHENKKMARRLKKEQQDREIIFISE